MRVRWEIGAFAVAALVLLVAFVLTRPPAIEAMPARIADTPHSPSAGPAANRFEEDPEISVEWQPPVPAAAEGGWTFDLFTPPLVFFDPVKERFLLRSALESPASLADQFQLLRLFRPLHQLQYAGHSGQSTGYLITLRDSHADHWHQVRVGESFAEGRYVLESFSVSERVSRSHTGATPVRTEEAVALVRDLLRDHFIEVRSSGPTRRDWSAEILHKPSQARRSLQVGDSWTCPSGVLVSVRGIDVEAGEVALRLEAPEGRFEETVISASSTEPLVRSVPE